jgi:hypothetical protein
VHGTTPFIPSVCSVLLGVCVCLWTPLSPVGSSLADLYVSGLRQSTRIIIGGRQGISPRGVLVQMFVRIILLVCLFVCLFVMFPYHTRSHHKATPHFCLPICVGHPLDLR